MLKAIRKLDRKQREGVLADLILSRSAPVEHPETFIAADMRDVYEALIAEVASTLHVDPNDRSPEVQRKVNSFLTRQLRELTFNAATVAESRNRLGQEGLLPSELYDLQFMDDFQKLAEPLGITRDEVRRAIFTPSLSEHYMPEKHGLVDAHAVSLFAKVSLDTDPHTLVVDCQRSGAKIEIHYALRIFHSDVDLSGCATVIEMLSTFSQKFGVDVSFADAPKKRFMFYESIPFRSSQTPHALMGWETKSGTVVDCRFTYKHTHDVWTVALGYAVDVTAYGTSLKEHGVSVRRKLHGEERVALAA
jgi:hypothetical protein